MIAVTCPACQKQFGTDPSAGGAVACPYCRSATTIPPVASVGVPMAQPKCSRVAYILLAIFLGDLGVHNFVAGYTARGVTQLSITLVSLLLFLCTFGLSGVGVLAVTVWWIVEVCTVDRDANGMKMS
jgi:TM2 domain-containing membrane protein YozV